MLGVLCVAIEIALPNLLALDPRAELAACADVSSVFEPQYVGAALHLPLRRNSGSFRLPAGASYGDVPLNILRRHFQWHGASGGIAGGGEKVRSSLRPARHGTP